MNFAKQLTAMNRSSLDIGFKAGFQKGCDLWMAALAKEGFGPERMLRMAEKVEALDKQLGLAWQCEAESDYAQEQLDRVLQPVCGERFAPFRERNPDIKQFDYKKRGQRK